MVEAKTGALFGCACALGALAGGATTAQVSALDRFGRHLGVAFQLADDLLGIWGDPAITGKPVSSDLAGGKKTLPIVAALTSGTPASARLATFYPRSRTPATGDLAVMAELVDQAGGRAGTQARAATELASALRFLRAAVPDPARAGDLSALAAWVAPAPR
jgi:geranylgeranyl diphosphate synthase type I